MAKRKAWQRALGGLGEGIANASQFALREQAVDRQNDRMIERQKIADDQNYKETLLKAVAEGADPAQVEAIAKARGIKLDRAALEGARPSLTRRLGPLTDRIAKAEKPEMLPSDEEMAGFGKGVGAFLPDEMMVPDALSNISDPFLAASGELKSARAQNETKRKQLESAPTERFTRTTPEGGVEEFFGPRSGVPVQTKPSARKQGEFKGQEKVSELETAGPALADQAELEATKVASATQDVTNSAKNQAARVAEARAKKRAELQEELAQSGMTPQQQSAALQLSDDFFNQSKEYFDVSQRFRNIATMAQRIREARNAGKDSPASHKGLIFNFMKMQDPGSTVSSSEQASAANAGGVEDRVRNMWNSLLLGGTMSDAQVRDFAASAGKVYEATKTAHQARIKDFSDKANYYRVPPAVVVREPDPALDTMVLEAEAKLRQRGGR